MTATVARGQLIAALGGAEIDARTGILISGRLRSGTKRDRAGPLAGAVSVFRFPYLGPGEF
jgi:hypothetical protein